MFPDTLDDRRPDHETHATDIIHRLKKAVGETQKQKRGQSGNLNLRKPPPQ